MSYVIWNGVALPSIAYTSHGISISPAIATTTTAAPAAIVSSALVPVSAAAVSSTASSSTSPYTTSLLLPPPLTHPTSQPILPVTGPGIPPMAVGCVVMPPDLSVETRHPVWCGWGIPDGMAGGYWVANVSGATAAAAPVQLRYTTTTTTVTQLPQVVLNGVTAIQQHGPATVYPITVQTARPMSLAWVVPR